MCGVWCVVCVCACAVCDVHTYVLACRTVIAFFMPPSPIVKALRITHAVSCKGQYNECLAA